MYTLRDKQVEAVGAVFKEWESVASTMILYPTGVGKTTIAAEIIRRRIPRRTLFIAHREELIFQARDRIQNHTGFEVDIEMGDLRSKTDADSLFDLPFVVVATIQTLTSGGDGSGRLSRFLPETFDTIIYDECVHAVSPTGKRVIDYFKQNPNAKILGLTAVSDRFDEQALGQVFDSVACDYEILDAINDGWLVPIEQQFVNVSGLDYSTIRTTAGDLNGADLARVMEEEEILHKIVSPTIEIIKDRRTLLFASSVKHAEKCCEIFNRHKAGMAEWAYANTPKEKRREILSRFACGEIQVLCNCGLYGEGVDIPEVEIVVMGRATKSRSLYAQFCGRAVRPLPGTVDGLATAEERRSAIASSTKPVCTILDFVGNSGRHKLICSCDILGGKMSEEVVERAIRKAKSSKQPVRMDQLMEEEAERMEQERQEAIRQEESRRSRLLVHAKYVTSSIDPFNVFQIRPTVERGWDRGKKLTDKQRGLLERQGIQPDSVTYHQGRELIGEIIHRFQTGTCSFRQARLLKRHGYPGNMSREEAGKTIDALAKSGWRRSVESERV